MAKDDWTIVVLYSDPEGGDPIPLWWTGPERKAQEIYGGLSSTIGHPCEDSTRAVGLYSSVGTLLAKSAYDNKALEEWGGQLPRMLPEESEQEQERVVSRSWGKYRDLYRTTHRVLKILCVGVGERTSAQRHSHRSEFWVVDHGAGRALLSLDGKKWIEYWLRPGYTLDIPAGFWHRIENTGSEELVMTELQHGQNCSEDDIERITLGDDADVVKS